VIVQDPYQESVAVLVVIILALDATHAIVVTAIAAVVEAAVEAVVGKNPSTSQIKTSQLRLSRQLY
jgi:hypothetical protein